MKIKENVTLYCCEYCGKEYKRQKSCAVHEERCNNNPKNSRPCALCGYFSMKKTKVLRHDAYDQQDEYYPVELFHCSKKESFLYPPSVGYKGNAFSQDDILGEVPNIEMPADCAEFAFPHEINR